MVQGTWATGSEIVEDEMRAMKSEPVIGQSLWYTCNDSTTVLANLGVVMRPKVTVTF